MSNQNSLSTAARLRDKLPYPLHPLVELAFNLWWSWSREASPTLIWSTKFSLGFSASRINSRLSRSERSCFFRPYPRCVKDYSIQHIHARIRPQAAPPLFQGL